MWIDLSEQVKDMKVFVSHVNALQRVPQQRSVYNQVAKMTHSLDTSRSLCSVTPVTDQRLINKVDVELGMDVLHGLRNITSTHQGQPGCNHC